MNTTAYLGPVTVQFKAGDDALDIYKASGYRKTKPDDMNPDDVYVTVDEGEVVTASFLGTADSVEVNEELFTGVPSMAVPLEDGVNEIAVTAGGKEYYLAVYVIREIDASHGKSGGIVWDEGGEFYYFDDMGFFEGIFSVFGSGTYEDDGITVSVPGELPWTPPEDGGGCCGGHCQMPVPAGTELPLVSEISPYVPTTPAGGVWPAATPEPESGGCCGGGCSEPAPEPTYSAPEPTYSPPAPSYSPPEPSYSPPSYSPPSYDSGSSSSSYDSGSSSSSCDSGGGGCGGGGD